jgi:hydroxyacylglutathione hydrolase
MEEIYPYLYRTEFQYLMWPVNRFKVNAFLLVRPEGNLLIYSSPKIEKHYDFIESKGGIKATLISHVHEASKHCNALADHFKADFLSPEGDKQSIEKKCKVDKTFAGDTKLDDSLEIISTPGHTPGSSCFVWTAPDGKRILFTGDNLNPKPKRKRGWGAYPMKNSDIPQIIDSLKKIQKLDIDAVVPGGYYHEDLFFQEVNKKEWEDICEDAIKSMNRRLN